MQGPFNIANKGVKGENILLDQNLLIFPSLYKDSEHKIRNHEQNLFRHHPTSYIRIQLASPTQRGLRDGWRELVARVLGYMTNIYIS